MRERENEKLDTILIPFIVYLILETNEQKLNTYVHPA